MCKYNENIFLIVKISFIIISFFFFFLCCFLHYFVLAEALDSKFSDESDELADEGISGPERTYRGPHIVFPLQKKDIDTLIDFFRKKKVCLRVLRK